MILYTVKVSFLARDRERTLPYRPMYIPGQNDRDEKLYQKKFTLTVTRTHQERNFHCSKPKISYTKNFYVYFVALNSLILNQQLKIVYLLR